MPAPGPNEMPEDPLRTLRRRARVLDRLLDDEGRVTRWPKRRSERLMILEYLVEFIPAGQIFNERAMGELLSSLHTFHDTALLRRQLIDHDLLERRRDGSAYWRAERA